MMRARPFIVIVVTVAFWGLGDSVQALAQVSGDNLHAHELRLRQIRLQLSEREAALRTARARLEDQRRQLHQTQIAIVAASAVVGRIDHSILACHIRVKRSRAELVSAQISVQRHALAYRRRLIQSYEDGELGRHTGVRLMAAIITARNVVDFIDRWNDELFLIQADQRTIATRKAAERSVDAKRLSLEIQEAKLLQTRSNQRQAQSRLATLVEERQNLVAVTEQKRVSAARDVALLDGLSAQEEESLERAIAMRQRSLEAQRRAVFSLGARPAHGSGQLMWPARGIITSPFGFRPNPFGGAPDFHPGLDIAASLGTPLVAADSGRVIIAGWVSGYGNYIAIDHGGGVSTAYGHCSRIDVSTGQDVVRGQVIGAIGSTGHSTGPHVHFEVRIDGKPVDPAPRLP